MEPRGTPLITFLQLDKQLSNLTHCVLPSKKWRIHSSAFDERLAGADFKIDMIRKCRV